MTEQVKETLAKTARTPDQINEAFWQACSGGQRRTAEFLFEQGADINAHPGYTEQSALQAAESPGTRRGALADWLREQGAAEA
jgi:ankyrin repeat protein